MEYDAMFSFGIIDSDISFEILAEESKMIPIIYIIDNENTQLPTELLFEENGLPKSRKPIIYQWIQVEQIENFNLNALLEPYKNIYLKISKQKFLPVVKKFKIEQYNKIKLMNLCGIETTFR